MLVYMASKRGARVNSPTSPCLLTYTDMAHRSSDEVMRFPRHNDVPAAAAAADYFLAPSAWLTDTAITQLRTAFDAITDTGRGSALWSISFP